MINNGMNNTHPITVIIPHMPARDYFFRNYCLPSIELNRPEKIIIEDGKGSSNEKRNRGAAKARTPYLFFCDDDVILARDALNKMLTILERNADAGYAYCDFYEINHPGWGGIYLHVAGDFDAAKLRQVNYINTMSLLRHSVFPGWDNKIPRLQDWDLWLTLLDREIKGAYIHEALFLHFFFPGKRITKGAEDYSRAKHMICQKHALQVRLEKVIKIDKKKRLWSYLKTCFVRFVKRKP